MSGAYSRRLALKHPSSNFQWLSSLKGTFFVYARVSFSEAFLARSVAYAAVAEAVFSDLCRRMAAAFEQRFAVLHRENKKNTL